ncbi:DUF721 domain-containing protein [Quadrisphaera sp. DSM 44207]|uniref:DUF721 domain-containing protein n=1 Tax=Quadrisphaera sp. DSM 44207 TaxID=1881057 RepID=UPI00088ABCA2|nr:DciA family protein [Quadrisphaera sp. DSM 44207]SDQ23044.1 Predicted nucleic acid-binding protein, contains Zn-ribbon domain (includes truncated derivatives) [Quadrisphaera sp. DSM 44207]
MADRPGAERGRPAGAQGAEPGSDAARVALNRARAAALARGARPAARPGRAQGGAGAGGGAVARRGGAPAASGAGPDARDPQTVSGSIDRLVAERGWQAPVAVGGVIGRWDQVVGADVAAHCTPETYADGVLTVRADSTAWATQVRLLAPAVLRRLGEELGEGVVDRLVVRGPAAPTWRSGPRSAADGRGPRDTYG